MRNEERKKIVLFGSEYCTNCHPVKEALEKAGVKFTYVDITSGVAQLQYFMKMRDVSDAYAEVRGSGRIGIPCLEVNDNQYIVGGGPLQVEQLIKDLELIW